MNEILLKIQSVNLSQYMSAGYLKYLGILCAAMLILSLAGRLFSKSQSIFRSTVGTLSGVLFMYIVIVAIDAAQIQLPFALPSLPFVQVEDHRLYILSLSQSDLNSVCLEFLHLLVLTFFVAVLDGTLPHSHNIFWWLLRGCLLLALSFASQALISMLFVTYFPAALVTWTPMILLGACILVMLLGLIKLIIGVAIAAMNPVLAAIYGFFFMHRIGKKLSTAVLTTILLGILLYFTDYFGFSVLSLAAGSILPCLPFLLLFLVFWYILA